MILIAPVGLILLAVDVALGLQPHDNLVLLDSVAIVWMALSLPIHLGLMALGVPEYLGGTLFKILVFLQWTVIAWFLDMIGSWISRWIRRT